MGRRQKRPMSTTCRESQRLGQVGRTQVKGGGVGRKRRLRLRIHRFCEGWQASEEPVPISCALEEDQTLWNTYGSSLLKGEDARKAHCSSAHQQGGSGDRDNVLGTLAPSQCRGGIGGGSHRRNAFGRATRGRLSLGAMGACNGPQLQTIDCTGLEMRTWASVRTGSRGS